MTKLERIKKVCKWLIFTGKSENESELALKLGYTKSSLSQILNGKVPLSDKFLETILSLDNNINKVWILNEEGSMVTIGDKDEYGISFSEKAKYFADDNIFKSNKILQVKKKVEILENFTTGLLRIIEEMKQDLDKEKTNE